jgi:asparagine synthase (glutamine-hydrolysing)
MCGILGELHFNGVAGASRPVLTRMADRLVHRGPDHDGFFIASDSSAALGFRRLSIIDLRTAANQPLPNEDGRVHLVFNGEIYNFRELRQGLISQGHQFRSNADSEVIVHLYEELGERAIDELDGMFALALWDAKERRLILARDRAGKKPLYIWRDADRLVFASEVKALLTHPAVTAPIDPDAVPLYFLHGYVPHPRTFYRGVRQLEPGTVLTVDADGRERERRYWQLTFPDERIASTPVAYHDAVARVRDLVVAAVQRRLVSDVPLGAFLSGGIDSTIIVGVMSRLMAEPVRTFSIGFDDPAFDETATARETAARLGTQHTEFRVQPSAVDLLDTLIWHYDGPFADSSAIPTFLVSQLTREHVTVALTGDGGDEVFAGYLRFAAAIAAERVPHLVGSVAGAALTALPTPRNERHWIPRGRRFVRALQWPLEHRASAWAGAFYDDAEDLLSGPRAAIDRAAHLRGLRGVEGASPLSRLLAANFHSYLHDDLLVKADRMTMANSLEGRAPFLDRALIEYVATLPDDYKLRGRATKAILRDAFSDLLPEQVRSRPKTGFGVPLDAWFRHQLRDYVRDLLLSPTARLREYVSQSYVQQLLDAHDRRVSNQGHRLWTLLTFERWLQLLPQWRAS